MHVFDISKAGIRSWKRDTKVSQTRRSWDQRNSAAVNTELTAYALLTLANRGDRINGVQVLKWIAQQRNPRGGFSSTQVKTLIYNVL